MRASAVVKRQSIGCWAALRSATQADIGRCARAAGEGRMKIRNRHERIVAAPPERIAALIAGFDRVWPAEIAPAPRRRGRGVYDAGWMRWEACDRPGAARAFRVVRPAGLRGEHWFEL